MGVVALREEFCFADNSEKIEELERLVDILANGKYVWESTFDAIQDPVLIIGADRRIRRMNLAGAKAAGIPIREVIGTLCYESLAGRETPCSECPLSQVLAHKKKVSVRRAVFQKSGKTYAINAYALDESRMERGEVVLHYRDMTEEEALYRKLSQNEKMAALGTLAGGVAHEINNPLSGILAFAQLIERTLPADSSIRDDLHEIETSALRCKEIVSGLLEFSRIPSSEPSPLDLNGLIQKLMPFFNVRTANTALHVKIDLSSPLPLIRGEAHKLQQVILNFMSNGLDAMKEKGGTLWVKTSAEGNSVFLDVVDEGEGIAEADLDKIFDPFFTTKKQKEGTGLGLSISYGIVKESGGSIEVKSRVGEGTAMRIRFPLVS